MGYKTVGIFLGIAAMVYAQSSDASYAPLQEAYEALRSKNYDQALADFKRALAAAPDRPGIHKDYGYALLKTGRTEQAREEFATVLRLAPDDTGAALEYGYLCHETGRIADARRTFDRLRQAGSFQAAEAFTNIDKPLAEGIARWTEALRANPDNLSVHEELAKIAEQRDDFALASEHYLKAWNLRPQRRDLLLALGRVWQQNGREQDALAALLSASRAGEPRTAESARELLPKRYPYVSEFERALALDPSNVGLRREFAYLLLAMSDGARAEAEFAAVVQRDPDDLLSTAQLGFLRLSRGDEQGALPLLDRVLQGDDADLARKVRETLHLPPPEEKPQPDALVTPPPSPADKAAGVRELAEISLKNGFLRDAAQYLREAHDRDPVDFKVMLDLGWTYNILKQDAEALKWFNLARRSPDPKLAAEAQQAYRNLEPGLRQFRTTFWAAPVFSTRWHDVFSYAQTKTEWRLPGIHPYVSARLFADSRGAVNVGLGPQYLSERSIILAVGLATVPVGGFTAWFEAGEALRYRLTPAEPRRITPDYRGGISFAKGFGHLLARGSRGAFFETNDDGVFLSRYGNDVLFYSQNRAGVTFPAAESLGGFHPQLLWNWNGTADLKRQHWANFVETGPGLRFQFDGLPASLMFSVSVLRGMYFIRNGNPFGRNYNEVRIGVWYAVTR